MTKKASLQIPVTSGLGECKSLDSEPIACQLVLILATHVTPQAQSLSLILWFMHGMLFLGCRIHDNVAMETYDVTWDFSCIKTPNKAPANLTTEGSNWLSTPCGLAIL